MPVAFLLIFQAITLEGWTDIMSYLMNGVSPFFGAVYMVLPTLTPKPNPNPNPSPSPSPNPNPNPNQVLLVFVVAWFLTNLALAVIYEQVLMAQKAQVKERDTARRTDAGASPRASVGAGQKNLFVAIEEAQPLGPAAKTATLAVAKSKAPFDWLGPPHSRYGLWCAKMIAKRWFGVLFPCLILLNTLLMCASLLILHTAHYLLLTAY